MSDNILKQLPKAVLGNVVVAPNPFGSSWTVFHAVKSSRPSYAGNTSEDAIIRGRRIAQSFNVSLFIEDSGSFREIPTSSEGEIDQNLLSKVRKLVAKAEGTDNQHERDIFLTKAQEWMIRHAIDMSTVKEEQKTMIERNIVIGKKGAGIYAKRSLVGAVATHCNLRAWSNTYTYYSTFAGYVEDVEYAELLVTSLLLQLEREYSVSLKFDKPAWTSALTFRANFMEAFVGRVRSRLSEMQRVARAEAAKTVREASGDLTESLVGDSVAMVLHNRRAKVDKWVNSRHKFVSVSRSMANYDAAGRQAGARAGNRADLSGGRTGRISNRKAVEA